MRRVLLAVPQPLAPPAPSLIAPPSQVPPAAEAPVDADLAIVHVDVVADRRRRPVRDDARRALGYCRRARMLEPSARFPIRMVR